MDTAMAIVIEMAAPALCDADDEYNGSDADGSLYGGVRDVDDVGDASASTGVD